MRVLRESVPRSNDSGKTERPALRIHGGMGDRFQRVEPWDEEHLPHYVRTKVTKNPGLSFNTVLLVENESTTRSLSRCRVRIQSVKPEHGYLVLPKTLQWVTEQGDTNEMDLEPHGSASVILQRVWHVTHLIRDPRGATVTLPGTLTTGPVEDIQDDEFEIMVVAWAEGQISTQARFTIRRIREIDANYLEVVASD